jgi:lysozyme
MNLGPRGTDLIKRGEELVLFTYDDAFYPPKPYKGGPVKGTLTIGYGHTAAAGFPEPVAGMRITKADAERIFNSDVDAVAERVEKLVKVPLAQHQFDALVSFQFNTGALGKSTLLKKLNKKLYTAVPIELMKWVHDGDPPKVLAGLVKRRTAEVELWNDADDAEIATGNTAAKPAPAPKAMTKSKIGNASLTTAAAGAISVADQVNQAIAAADATKSSLEVLFDLLQRPAFVLVVAIVLLGGAIWYWRRGMLKEEAA